MSKSFKEALHEILGDKLPAVAKFFAERKEKFAADPSGTNGVPPSEQASVTPQTKIVTSKDGKRLSIEGDIVEGVSVYDMTSGTKIPAPDADYELEDGTIVSVKGGVITGVKMPGPIDSMPADLTAATAALRAEFSAQKVAYEKVMDAKFAAQQKVITEHTATLADHNIILKHAVDFMYAATNTPVAEKKPEVKEVKQIDIATASKEEALAHYRALKQL